MEQGAVLPLFYLPPVEYFSKLIKFNPHILFEIHEHFPKQTYRNRACIYSPNGKLDLIIPVKKGANGHTAMKDVKISYDFDWQRLHWQSMQTCYRSSAYFEFYEDELAPFYEKKFDFLKDYNEQLLSLLLRFLKIDSSINYTQEYKLEADKADFRSCISPKHPSNFTSEPYFQVFEQRNGFLPNLSIVDLLFNQGPRSLSFIDI